MLRQGLRLRLEVLLRDDLVGRQGLQRGEAEKRASLWMNRATDDAAHTARLAGAGHHGRGLLLVVFQSQGCLLTLGLSAKQKQPLPRPKSEAQQEEELLTA